MQFYSLAVLIHPLDAEHVEGIHIRTGELGGAGRVAGDLPTVAQNINQPESVVKDSKRNIFPAYTRLANKFHLKANISQNKQEQAAREM